MPNTKAEIREEYLLLLEIQGYLALAEARAERLGITAGRRRLLEDITVLWHKAEHKAGIQYAACQPGHGVDS